MEPIALILEGIGIACWGVCFWWMHSLSARQEAMLQELHDVTRRIEKLSEREHDLIQEVHPTVEKIQGIGKRRGGRSLGRGRRGTNSSALSVSASFLHGETLIACGPRSIALQHGDYLVRRFGIGPARFRKFRKQSGRRAASGPGSTGAFATFRASLGGGMRTGLRVGCCFL